MLGLGYLKKCLRRRHTFSDEDRNLAELRKAEVNEIKRIQLERERIAAMCELEQQKQEFQMLKQSFTEQNNDADSMLMQLFSQILSKKQGLNESSQHTLPELSKSQLYDMKTRIPPSILADLQKMTDQEAKVFITSHMPMSEQSLDNAIEVLRNGS